MKLQNFRSYNTREFKCELTEELDNLSGLDKLDFKRHYILIDSNELLTIRIPGGTVGSVHIKDNIIVSVYIATDYVVKTYPKNINEIMKKYIGTKIDIIRKEE